MPPFTPGPRCSAAFKTTAFAAAMLAVLFALGTILDAVQAGGYQYPEAKKVDVTDDYHGKKIADPYRWLEDPDGDDTVEWVGAENALTRSYVDSYAGRDGIVKWFTNIWNYPRYSLPYKHGDRYFFSKNDGLQNQSVVYMQKSLDGKASVVIDPNKLSGDGTVALRNSEHSPEHFEFMYEYSPLHNVEPGTNYPPTLITSADTDDRVVPAHAKKFAAALQAAGGGQNPLLLRVETKAGHGGGKPMTKVIEEYADIYSFVLKTMGISSESL